MNWNFVLFQLLWCLLSVLLGAFMACWWLHSKLAQYQQIADYLYGENARLKHIIRTQMNEIKEIEQQLAVSQHFSRPGVNHATTK